MKKEFDLLKKEFELHSYLSHQALKKVKEDLDMLQTKYRMEKSTDLSQVENQSIRF